MIEWARSQAALTRAGYPCGKLDGIDLEKTWTALFAFAAGRQADDVLRALGRAAVAWLREDAIAHTAPRLAEFIAQTAHETGVYTRFEEDLRYTAKGLAETWPGRYAVNPHAPTGQRKPLAKAIELARAGPAAIGADTYGLRMGNLDADHDTDTSPDGWQYRGRGMLQLTGRANYALYAQVTGLPLLTEPDLAADPADSLVIAREVWSRMQVNTCCDRGDFYGARGLTNAGSARPKVKPIGLEDVAKRRARLLTILS